MCDHLPSPDTLLLTPATLRSRGNYSILQKDFLNPYVPGWDSTCEVLGNDLDKAKFFPDKQEAANKLLEHLNRKRKAAWKDTVEDIDMKHSSCKACATIDKLTDRKNTSPKPHSMNPDAVASCLIQNGKFKQPNQEFTRNFNRQLKMEWNFPSAYQDTCGTIFQLTK